ncbi:MAG: response regulator [Candidatus Hodarchaeota archaeon]
MMSRIMIVEDEESLHALYKRMLNLKNHEVVAEAYNGVEAIDLFIKTRPEIIIMDYRLPSKDGLEATKEILKIDPNVKIIFASADTTVKTLALQAGAVAFHVKPFSMRDLFTTIEALR